MSTIINNIEQVEEQTAPSDLETFNAIDLITGEGLRSIPIIVVSY